MAEFAYNNTKNASFGYIFFELNCGYYLYMSYKEDANSALSLKRISIMLKNFRNGPMIKALSIIVLTQYYTTRLNQGGMLNVNGRKIAI